MPEYSIWSVHKLHSLTLEEGTSATKYIKQLTIQLANVGEFVSKSRKVQIMFGVLPNTYEMFIQSTLIIDELPG